MQSRWDFLFPSSIHFTRYVRCFSVSKAATYCGILASTTTLVSLAHHSSENRIGTTEKWRFLTFDLSFNLLVLVVPTVKVIFLQSFQGNFAMTGLLVWLLTITWQNCCEFQVWCFWEGQIYVTPAVRSTLNSLCQYCHAKSGKFIFSLAPKRRLCLNSRYRT